MPSERVENYLKAIYGLADQQGKVTTSLLSERLGVSAASVSEMLQRLGEDGMVTYMPYRGVALTEAGRRHALRILRRHRLWELFLVKVLKFGWDEIHEEAERLEHITSERLEQSLDAALGYPRIDPHGHLIPSADGVLQDDRPSTLAEVPTGAVVSVLRVSDSDPAMLQHLAKLGIGIQQSLRIKERMPFDGSMRVEIEGQDQFLSEKLARQIFVRETQPAGASVLKS